MGQPALLLERGAQLETIDALLAVAAAGAGRVAVVEGPPGIGKTAFLAVVAEHSRARGTEVLDARASAFEQGFAFGVVRQLFERRLAAAPPAERRALLAGAASLAGPVVGAQDGPSAALPHPGDDLYPSLHGLYWLTANLAARRSLLLAVDDGPWADLPSLRFCEYLARRLDGLSVLLLLTARVATVDPRLAALSIDPATTVIRLPDLTENAVAALARIRFGDGVDDALVAGCYRSTGGNPFLVQEMLAWLATHDTPRAAALLGEAPPTVQASVLHRLRQLSTDAQTLATAAAVLDANATVSRTAALADVTLGAAAAAADDLDRAGLFTDGRPFRFVHALVRAAVLAAIPGAERCRLHGRAARLFHAEGAEAALIARHLAEVDPMGEPWVIEALEEAARQSLAHGQPAIAAAWLRRGLTEPSPPPIRARLLRNLGRAEQRLGESTADEHFRQAFALSDDPIERAATLRALLLGLLTEGRGDEVLRMLDTTLPDVAARELDLAEQVEAEVLSAARHTVTGSLWLADRLRSWRGRANPDRPGGRLLLANLATQCALDGGSAVETARLAELALAGGRLHQEQTADAMPVYQAIWQLIAAERLDAAEPALALALADGRRRGSVAGFALASLFHSYLELARGTVPAAEADVAAALDAAHQARADWFATPAVVAALVDVFVEQGRLKEAWRLLEQHRWCGALPDSVPHRLLLHSRGRLHLVSGQARAAAADFLDHLDREQRLQAVSTHLVPSQAGAALALRASGDVATAATHAALALVVAQAWGAPRVVAHALRVRATVEPPRVAVATLTEAVRLLPDSPARLEQAWAHLDLGAALVRVGRRAEGGQALRVALDLGHHCGGHAVAQAARAALIASGYRPRRAAATGVDALTGSERRVAELATRDLANRAIAQVLFVTERTVELHLTNAYQKLGVSSRRALGAALGDISEAPAQP